MKEAEKKEKKEEDANSAYEKNDDTNTWKLKTKIGRWKKLDDKGRWKIKISRWKKLDD